MGESCKPQTQTIERIDNRSNCPWTSEPTACTHIGGYFWLITYSTYLVLTFLALPQPR